MTIELKGGATTENPKLDRVYELDWNSLNYPVTAKAAVAQAINKPRSFTWFIDLWLDQGQQGACVGNGYAHELAAKPVQVVGIDEQFAHDVIYWQTQREDPWPGGEYPGATPRYSGTSVLTGAKVVQELGFYSAYHWALNIQELAIGIGYDGPAVLGVNWYEGMDNPDAKGFLHVSGKVVGGHCILANGVRIVWKTGSAKATWADVDLDKSYLKLHNSWGKDWGVKGGAYLSLSDMDRLLNEQGDACFPTRVKTKTTIG